MSANHSNSNPNHSSGPLRERIWRIIFHADSPAGKTYDILLLFFVITSVIAMMLETVEGVSAEYGSALRIFDIIVTILFGIDYFVRLWCVRKKARYAFSFFGIIDLLAWLPSLIALIIGGGGHAVAVVRILRTLRVFRVLKMASHNDEANVILLALLASRAKITVFLFGILSFAMIMGTFMYLMEGQTNPQFSSIPKAIYWAVVTITTVGYGDMTPTTAFGQFVSTAMMILGYAIIAVPTGIVSFEINRETSRQERRNRSFLTCPNCSCEDHRQTANFCYDCGTPLKNE